jgi:CRISPR-associated protein Cas4
MTKHIYIDDYGTFLGKTSARLTISQNGEQKKEVALSRIKSINILKGGISLSSDLIEACSLRGIKIFFLDFKNVAHTSLSSTASHAVANTRRAQFLTIESDFNFYGICDALIISDKNIYPVEIKLHGTKPTKAQKMQLLAYGILAEKIYKKEFNLGFILFEKNAKTIPIEINENQKMQLVVLVDKIIEMIKKEKLPYSDATEEKCTQCEFENYCNDRF